MFERKSQRAINEKCSCVKIHRGKCGSALTDRPKKILSSFEKRMLLFTLVMSIGSAIVGYLVSN